MIFDDGDCKLFVKEIQNIIWTRWRMIENSTMYGWISAKYSLDLMISEDDVKQISNLVSKLNSETRDEALKKIANLSENLHPKVIPDVVIQELEELYIIFLLRKRERQKVNIKVYDKDRECKIYTIC